MIVCFSTNTDFGLEYCGGGDLYEQINKVRAPSSILHPQSCEAGFGIHRHVLLLFRALTWFLGSNLHAERRSVNTACPVLCSRGGPHAGLPEVQRDCASVGGEECRKAEWAG